MIFNYIFAALAVILLSLSILSVFSEDRQSEKASSRNFFRRLRITLREFSGTPSVITAVLVLLILPKKDEVQLILTIFTAVICPIAGFILVPEKNLRKSSKRKKERQLITKRIASVKEAAELSMLTSIPVKEETK